MQIKVIARFKCELSSKFGVPRQSGILPGLKGAIVFEPEYRNDDALRGLDNFSHIWLIWGFSETERDTWSPTVRPPRLGGNTRMGVFATRSPYRPNAVGLSSVRLDRIERHPELGAVIHVLGADLMDGTPIYDIKPYLPYSDCHPDAGGGFASAAPEKTLKVTFNEKCTKLLPEESRNALMEILAFDPRPSYQNDPDRVYGMGYGEYNVKFTIDGNSLKVIDILPKTFDE